MSKKTGHADENLQDVEQALTTTEQFFERNQRIITIVFGAAVALAVIFLSFHRFYTVPQEKKASEQMFVAEQYFEKDSFNLAINGDGNYPGFLDIIDDFGSTKSGNLANYYTGICYLHLGDYEEAIEYLEAFDTNDALLAPVAVGATADAYAELGEKEKAADLYLDAASLSDNNFTAPIYLMKAGKMFEVLGKTDKALDAYQEVKENYATSAEGRQVEKFIARLTK